MGYCKNLFANVPEGRISMKKVVENYHTLTQEDVKRLVTEPKKGWDMVIFAVGCDPPRSNSIDDVIEQNTVISRLCLVSYFGAPAKSLKQLLPLSDEFGRCLICVFFRDSNWQPSKLDGQYWHWPNSRGPHSLKIWSLVHVDSTNTTSKVLLVGLWNSEIWECSKDFLPRPWTVPRGHQDPYEGTQNGSSVLEGRRLMVIAYRKKRSNVDDGG